MSPTIKGELVQFLATDKIILHGFLSRPKNKSDKVIVHLHGLEGSFYQNDMIKVIGNKATRNGFNFLSIEQRGSYNVWGIKKKSGKKIKWVTVGGDLEKFEECLFDISGAINYLHSKGMNKIYLEGHSTGCQKATYYLYKTKDRKVKGLILIAPCDDYAIWKRDLKGKFNSAIKFAKKHVKSSPNLLMNTVYPTIQLSTSRFLSLCDLSNVESRIFNYDLKHLNEFSSIRVPTLAVFGTKDQYAVRPVKTMLNILQKNSRSAFKPVVINSVNHSFEGKEENLASLIVNWLKTF